MITIELARRVLEALNSFPHRHLTPTIFETRKALRQALAAPTVQEPVDSAAKGQIMGAAYDFRDAHISGSMNLKQSAHAALENAVDAALKATQPAAQPAPVQPMESLLAAIQAEPVTLIHKWRVLELVKEHAAQPAPVQPVAWLQIGLAPFHDGDVIARKIKPKDWNPEWWRFEPLYTTPQPAHAQPVAWEDGPHLVVRSDMRERLNYKGPWVDMGRAIPDAWVPILYTTPPAPTALKPCRSPYCECSAGQCSHPGCYDARHEEFTPPATKPEKGQQ